MPAVSGPTAVTVGTSAVAITFTADFPNGALLLQKAADSGTIYIDTTAPETTATGCPLPKGAFGTTYPYPILDSGLAGRTVHVIADSASQTLYVYPG